MPNNSEIFQVRSTVHQVNRIAQLAAAFPARSELHISRKIWHMGMGLFIVFCFSQIFSQTTSLAIMSVVFVLSALMETVRLRYPSVNEVVCKSFGKVIRSSEVSRVSGMPYFIASSVFSIAVFPKPVAVLALLFLTFGDPVASFFGILFKHRSVQIIKGKSLHGTAAGFVICSLVAWIYLQSIGMAGLDLLRLTLLGGFAGSVAEMLPLDMDDNFTIPVVSGFLMWLGFIAIHLI